MGEHLAKVEKNKGSRNSGGLKNNPPEPPPTLAEMGIDKNEANTARTLAAASPEVFEAGLRALKAADDLSESSMARLMREAIRDGLTLDDIAAAQERYRAP
jgi:hypothetical protein